jgi:hypothetical protein
VPYRPPRSQAGGERYAVFLSGPPRNARRQEALKVSRPPREPAERREHVSRATGHKWLARWRAEGPPDCTTDPPCAPTAGQDPDRTRGPGAGAAQLAWLDRPTGQLIRRYERARPGELVHVDVKNAAGHYT